ncbi:MAG: aquaporin [Planctomycetes bacterium]|nr:aquaporin [Planctomycetota bacterium]MBI3846201.1 aquaporin [Planctomycetota bacterium]
MNGLFKPCLAEVIGTFTLTFIGAAAICTDAVYAPIGLLGIAIAHGLALSIAVSATGAISGGVINPAIAIALLVARKLTPSRCVAFIVAELVGAVIAGYAVHGIFPDAAAKAHWGTPVPGPGISGGTAVLVEAILTFLLATSVFLTAVDPRAPKSIAGFGIGLTIAMDILACGPITGASMNPARTFGPALACSVWDMHWVYWVGPALGAIVAAICYVAVFEQKDARAA